MEYSCQELGISMKMFQILFSLVLSCFSLNTYASLTQVNTNVHDIIPSDPYAKKYAATVGLQIPTGVFLELNYKPTPQFSFSMGGGGLRLGGLLIDTGAAQGGVTNTINTLAVEGRIRWHTGSGPFFLGLATGWLNFSVDGIDGSPTTVGTLSRFYITPHIGWIWVYHSGFVLGTELGVQVPFSHPELTFTGPKASRSDKARKDLDPLLSSVFPYINLIKVGYSF